MWISFFKACLEFLFQLMRIAGAVGLSVELRGAALREVVVDVRRVGRRTEAARVALV